MYPRDSNCSLLGLTEKPEATYMYLYNYNRCRCICTKLVYEQSPDYSEFQAQTYIVNLLRSHQYAIINISQGGNSQQLPWVETMLVPEVQKDPQRSAP